MKSPFTPIQAIQNEQREGWVAETKPLESQLAEKDAQIAQLQSERENWRVSSVCREMKAELNEAHAQILALREKHNIVGSCKIDRIVVEAVDRLTAELACLQKTYEAERNCSAERMAKIHAHEEEIRRLTARTVGQLSEITILHQLLDVEETKLATVTTERDRLQWRPVSVKPTKEDADAEGFIAVTDGKDCDAWPFGEWADILPCYTHWLAFCPPPAPSAQEVERERFEKAWREYCPTDHFTVDEKAAAWHMWQAACAVKEGEG